MVRSRRRTRATTVLLSVLLAVGAAAAGTAATAGSAATAAPGARLEVSGAAGAAPISPSLLALRPVKGVSYQPSPSDDCVWQLQHCGGSTNGATYFDSDFFNTDFVDLWGRDSTGAGRDDLTTIKDSGVNLLHLYSWNPQRDHGSFLDAVASAGMKTLVPVTNYTACAISGGCQGIAPGAGSYSTAFTIIQNTFDQVYINGSTSPHPAVAAWTVFNEYDLNSIDPTSIAFVIQAILQLEEQANIPVTDRLPFLVPVSNAEHTQAAGAQPAYFAQAEALYLAANPGQSDATVPPGLLPVVAVSVALQNAQTAGTTTYQGPADSGPVTVAAMPAEFWSTRHIAAVNPFSDGPTLNRFVTDPGQFQSAWPGKDVTASGVTWTAAWNALPPLLFTETGINIGGAGGTPQGQAEFLLRQLECTMPWAADASSTPQGYFLGATVFEFSNEDQNGQWGMFVFPDPLQYTTAQTTAGASYRVDTLNQQPAWASVPTGFAATAKDCS
jgi:hypothetical protein